MRNALDDLRYAWRQLRRTPGFTVVAVVTLALGIGANTTFYALVDAAFWRPLRVMDTTGVYDVSVIRPQEAFVPGKPLSQLQRWFSLNAAQLEHISQDRSLGVIATARVSSVPVTVQSPAGAIRTFAEIVSGNFQGVFDMRPLVGSLADLRDDSAAPAPSIVISERVWRQLFQSDPSIVGRETLRINGRSFVVAGVMPREFAIRGSNVWVHLRAWKKPFDPPREIFGATLVRFRRDQSPARLKPLLDASLAKSPSPPDSRYKASLSQFVAGYLGRREADSYTWMTLGLATLVLIAACANLANMLYARAAHRTGEIAVRLSLGAGPARIFRLFLLEAAIISAFAAALGLVMTFATLEWVSGWIPGGEIGQRLLEMIVLTPDWRTFAAALAAGTLAALVVGGVTAWRGSRVPPLRMFGASGIAMATPARGKWMRTLLVAVQVSAAVMLLFGTSLFLLRAITSPHVTVTYDKGPLATAQLEFAPDVYRDFEMIDALTGVLARAKSIDGVERAAVADGLIGGSYSSGKTLKNLVAEDESMPGQMSGWRRLEGQQAAVSPELLDTLGLKIVSGRGFNDNDREGAPDVVLLSASAVKSLWPGLDPLGRRVRLASDPRWFKVIGVFDDPLRNSADSTWACRGCVAFSSWRQKPSRNWLLVLRSTAPAAAAQQIVRTVAAVDERIPVFNPAAATASIFVPINPQGLIANLFGTLGILSLAIAALGVYGVISYSVSRRTREFGIRLALGATPRGILRAVLDDAVHLVLVGLLPGVLLAAWATRVLEARIVELMPNDIATWAAVPVVVLLIGVLAASIPARRAARVDPNVALRDL